LENNKNIRLFSFLKPYQAEDGIWIYSQLIQILFFLKQGK